MRLIAVIGLMIIFSAAGLPAFSQKQATVKQAQVKIPGNFCISPVEVELYNMINEYRRLYGLPAIPISRSLSYVAKTHVRDLYFNRPEQGSCNFHSWSDKGNWKPFCYPRDEKKNSSVWDKPKEISPYKSKGYEIVYWENNPVTLDSILPFWKSIEYFNNFLVSSGKWQGKNWMSLGIGIYENYAVAWFGEIPDPEGEPWICGQEPVKDTRPKESKADNTGQIISEKVVTNQRPIISSDTASKTDIYYIVVSSQQPRAKSKQLEAELIAKGYKDAKMLIKNGKVRVSILEVYTKPGADSALREVKKTYKDAWIYKTTR
jgi:hypothetical protein